MNRMALLQCIKYFFPHNVISPYLHFFVTTKRSSTYKQITMDSDVRKLDYIRTLVTKYDNKTHNNAPKGDWKWINTVRHYHNTVNFPQILTKGNPYIACWGEEWRAYWVIQVWIVFCCCQYKICGDFKLSVLSYYIGIACWRPYHNALIQKMHT